LFDGNAEPVSRTRSRRNPSAESSSAPSFASTPQTSTTVSVKRSKEKVDEPVITLAKRVFKRIGRAYMRKQRTPSASDLAEINQYHHAFTWQDIIEWSDQISLRHGVTYDDDGTVLFEEWPIKPHDQIVDEISLLFDTKFRSPYVEQAGIHPTFVGDRATGRNPSSFIQI
jgi:hypothetical protein